MQIEPSTLPTDEQEAAGVSRRTLLRGAAVAGVVGVAATTLVACGDDDADTSTGGTTDGGAATVKTADIPVGGGQVVDANGEKVVVTQPTDGEFKAFSAICTHQGCTVNEVANGVISCPCHGSKYSAADGSVEAGPAPAPLSGVNISVSGGDITIG
jgi:Rieske Fe-S protein